MTVFNNLIVTAVAASLWSAASTNNGGKAEVGSLIQSNGRAKSNVHLETLRVPRASELVAERLRSLIVMGKVATGDSLPSEKELVNQLGVSRATLREALRMLETEGLIATRPGPKGGIVVLRPDAANLTRSLALLLQLEETPFEIIFEARRLLEPLCASLAAERATPPEIEQLRQQIEIMRQSVGNVSSYVAAQLSFHLTVINAAHNDVLRLYTISVGEVISNQTASVGLTETEQLIGLKAVEGILRAILGKNGKLAARRTESHLHGFETILLQRLAVAKN